MLVWAAAEAMDFGQAHGAARGAWFGAVRGTADTARKALSVAYKVFANAAERHHVRAANAPNLDKPWVANGSWGKVPRPVWQPVFVFQRPKVGIDSPQRRRHDAIKCCRR